MLRTTWLVTWAAIFSGTTLGRHLWSFFLKPVLGDDPFDAAGADGPAALPQLLRDNLRGGVGVEKAMPDDLSDHFGRSPILRFGTAFLAVQCNRAGLLEGGAELKVTLLAETELCGGLQRSRSLAFTFHEHHELPRDLVILTHVQDTAGPDQTVAFRIELCHVCFLHKGDRLLGPCGTSLPASC